MLDRIADRLASWFYPPPPQRVTRRRYLLTWHGQPVETLSQEQLLAIVYQMSDTIDRLEAALIRAEGESC